MTDDIEDYTNSAPSAEDLAEEAWGHLASHPDPVLRYQAISHLENRLRHLRALSAKQLELERGGLQQAADALGITRQAVTELYARTDTPGPRADRDRTDRPAHAYGRWLALTGMAAESAGQGHRWDKLYVQASRTTTVFPAMARAAEQWLRRSGKLRAELHDLLDAASPAATEFAHPGRQLTMAEQGDIVLAVHSTRHDLRAAASTTS